MFGAGAITCRPFDVSPTTTMRRDSAEAASVKLYNTLNINGKNLRLAWGKRAGGPGGSAPPGVAGGSALPPDIKATASPLYPSQTHTLAEQGLKYD